MYNIASPALSKTDHRGEGVGKEGSFERVASICEESPPQTFAYVCHSAVDGVCAAELYCCEYFVASQSPLPVQQRCPPSIG